MRYRKPPKKHKISVKLVGLVLVVMAVTFAVIKVQTFHGDVTSKLSLSIVSPDFSPAINTDQGSTTIAVNGKIIESRDGDKVRPTASTAKMILALAVVTEEPFEAGESGIDITLDQRDVKNYDYQLANGGSRTEVKAGAVITEKEALEAVLLGSSNNMADSLVQHIFGSQKDYQDYAHDMLFEMGLKNTTIGSDASGLSPTTTSTSNDLAAIGSAVLKNSALAEIVGLKEVLLPIQGKVKNTNYLLSEDSSIIGIKTGFTDEAGSCFTLGAKVNGGVLVVSIMGDSGASSRAAISDAYNTYLAAAELAKDQVLVKKGAVVGELTSDWYDEPVKIYADADVKMDIWDKTDVTSKLVLDEELIEKTGKIGTLKVTAYGKTISIPVSIKTAMPNANWIYKLFT